MPPFIMTIVGARPQFVKAAVVSRALRTRGRVQEVIVHTGQHFDDNMSGAFFRDLDIPAPAYNLDIHGGPHGQMTGRMLEGLEQLMLARKPALVLVYGDTNSTLAGALAAAKLHVPVAHVEAGLRSFNRRMPEEVNRVMVDHLSALLFCPTATSVDNLAREGIREGVQFVGDVMHDATLFARSVAETKSEALERLGLTAGRYAICTLHRSENTDDPARLQALLAHVERAAGELEVLLPVHPRTRAVLEHAGLATGRLRLLEPLGYFDMQRLLACAALVLTDSGGLQKEAYFHRIPCVTLREETEWVETVTAGWNRLWRSPAYASPRVDIPDYGTGNAGAQVAAALEAWL